MSPIRYKQLSLWASEPAKFIFILISGKAGVGKSTFGEMISNHLVERGKYTVDILPFAEEVKRCARTFFGWNGKKDEKGRKLLQLIGTEVGRWYDKDVWVKRLLDKTRSKTFYPDFVIVDDWRYPNEAEYLEKLGEYEIVKVRIVAPEREILKGEDAKHLSENSLPDGGDYYDSVIPNGVDFTILDLDEMAKMFVDNLFERS